MSSIPLESVAEPLVMTVDVGTSAVRAMLFDRLGRSVEGAEARASYNVHVTHDGGVEVDAEELLASVETSIDRLLSRVGSNASRIAGVGVCTFWHNLMAVDARDRPLTPVYTWADTRASAVAADLRRRWDEAAYHRRTGCPLHPSYLPAKLIWLHNARPDVMTSVRRWLSFGEFLYLRLFGQAACSISMASGTGLLNKDTCTWDEEVLSRTPLGSGALSSLVDLDQPQRGLRALYASRWPALRTLPWFPALGDGACSNIGGACFSPRRITLMVGTSGAMRVVFAAGKPVEVPFGLWCYRVDRRRLLIGGALSNGGNLLAWLRSLMKLESSEEIEQQVSQMAPDSHGLTVLPFLAGERSMGWVGEARAAFVGLSLHTEPTDLMRAGMEAVAYRFALIYRALQQVIPAADDREIVASGGALLHSPTWMQMMADVLGQPVSAVAGVEASSRGAALLALEAMGVLPSLEDAPLDLGPTYIPDGSRHERYQSGIERQRKLYDLLIGSGLGTALTKE